MGCRTAIASENYGAAVSYKFGYLPSGLKGSLQGVITGTPTNNGVFTVSVTGYEHADLEGENFVTPFPVNITDQALFITAPPPPKRPMRDRTRCGCRTAVASCSARPSR